VTQAKARHKFCSTGWIAAIYQLGPEAQITTPAANTTQTMHCVLWHVDDPSTGKSNLPLGPEKEKRKDESDTRV